MALFKPRLDNFSQSFFHNHALVTLTLDSMSDPHYSAVTLRFLKTKSYLHLNCRSNRLRATMSLSACILILISLLKVAHIVKRLWRQLSEHH